jgi:hypothetical protein
MATGPSLSDLESEYEKIADQLAYWRGVASAAREDVNGLKSKVRTANDIFAEIATREILTREDREDRDDATAALAKIAPDLESAERRLKNAELQIKTWTDRDKAFDRQTYSKLKAAESRRRRLKV